MARELLERYVMSTKKPELLAPAGDLEKLKIAFMYGADAVYAGVPDFGMRVRQIGFDLKSMEKGIKYAHDLGKKVYVTVNIFAHNADIRKLPKFLGKLARLNPDALIVADPGVFQVIKDLKIQIPLHLSTQANVTNHKAVEFWHDQGFERIILAREVDWRDIRLIHKKLPKSQLEIFVHGAICMSYSGRCNISNYLTNRDANQGDCSHCCRWEYDVYLEERQRPGNMMKVEQDERGSYFFNSKDLCLIGQMDKVLNTGVVSLKIEGRNKSIFYLATVVRVYRKALDMACDSMGLYNKQKNRLKRELESINTRGYSKGFFGGNQKDLSSAKSYEKQGNRKFVGLVKGRAGDLVKIEARNQIMTTDKLEVMTPDKILKLKISNFLDEKGKDIGKVVNTNKLFFIKSCLELPEYSFVRKHL
ncbi:U32 family peptidase C-terminal domain-containing protein [Patescibacteria group bacterium]|nr:U32 family peptidase C-terminal domain-containing protein [Patescibacteria group bacterium]